MAIPDFRGRRNHFEDDIRRTENGHVPNHLFIADQKDVGLDHLVLGQNHIRRSNEGMAWKPLSFQVVGCEAEDLAGNSLVLDRWGRGHVINQPIDDLTAEILREVPVIPIRVRSLVPHSIGSHK